MDILGKTTNRFLATCGTLDARTSPSGPTPWLRKITEPEQRNTCPPGLTGFPLQKLINILVSIETITTFGSSTKKDRAETPEQRRYPPPPLSPLHLHLRLAGLGPNRRGLRLQSQVQPRVADGHLGKAAQGNLFPLRPSVCRSGVCFGWTHVSVRLIFRGRKLGRNWSLFFFFFFVAAFHSAARLRMHRRREAQRPVVLFQTWTS